MSDCKQKYIEWSTDNGSYCGEYEEGKLKGLMRGTDARNEFDGWEACWNARQEEIDQLKAQLEVKHSAPNHKTQFEGMIRQSPDFATLLNIHGDRLFIKRELSCDVLAMRLAYWTWLWVHTLYKDVSETCSEMVDEVEGLKAEIDQLKAEKAGLEKQVHDIQAYLESTCGDDLVSEINRVIHGVTGERGEHE